MKIRRTVGIDLGTTRSAIALLDPTDTRIVVGQESPGQKVIPSLVGFCPNEQRLVVGTEAALLQRESPEAVVPIVKALDQTITLGPKSWQASDLLERVLRHLRDCLVRSLQMDGYLLDRVVFAVPLAWDAQRTEPCRPEDKAGTLEYAGTREKMVRRASEAAGFERVEFLPQPIAAVMAHAWLEDQGEGLYLVLDIGTGYRAAIVRRCQDRHEVLGSVADPGLGTEAINRILIEHIRDHSLTRHPSPICLDEMTPTGRVHVARLRQLAQSVGIELLHEQTVQRYVPDLLMDEKGSPVTVELEVTRTALDALLQGWADRLASRCQELIRLAETGAGIRAIDIEHLLLVGGGGQVPIAQRSLTAALSEAGWSERIRCVFPWVREPELCHALGAAVQAAGQGTQFILPPKQEGAAALEVRLTSRLQSQQTSYRLMGRVDGPGTSVLGEGASLLVHSLETGLLEEAFLGPDGGFDQEVLLEPDRDNRLELTLCDPVGQEVTRWRTSVRHWTGSRPRSLAGLPEAGPGLPLPCRPTRTEIDQTTNRIQELLATFGANYRARAHAEVCRLVQELKEGLRRDDDALAIRRMADLRELRQRLETNTNQLLDPPWPQFANLVKRCLHLAATVADRTGRDREELFTAVYAQERYAEQAAEERDQKLYRECLENLTQFAGYLGRMLQETEAQPARRTRPADEEAREGLEVYRRRLADVWRIARERQRADLEDQLKGLAEQGKGLGVRLRAEPEDVLRELRRLIAAISRIEQELAPLRKDEG